MRHGNETSAGQHDAVRHVLLYGTLCAGEPAHRRLALGKALTFLGRRSVPGRLYDLGPYPGLVLGTGSAPVELHRIDDPNVLALVDRYEGYDPHAPSASLFVRRCVRVVSHPPATSATLEAWIYEFNGPVDGYPEIRGASWPEHRRRRVSSRRGRGLTA